MTSRGQKILQDACIIAGIEQPRLISETTATVITYAYEKMSLLLQLTKPKIVAFIDVGNSKSTITVAKYYVDKNQVFAEIICEESDRNLGGRNLD